MQKNFRMKGVTAFFIIAALFGTLTVLVWRRTDAPCAASDLTVPIFGAVLSLGMAVLALLLVRRMEMYKSARDEALRIIADREKAEAVREETENRYRNVFDSVTDGLLVLDGRGKIIEANRVAAKMHGLTPGELIGMKVDALIAPEKHYLVKEFDRRLHRDGEVRLDSVHLHKSGSRIDVEVRGTRIVKSGEPLRLAIFSDVSDRKRSEERHAALSRKAIAAQEDERARLSMEMHDELGQILTALRLDLGLVRKQHAATEGSDFLSNAAMMAERATDELRRLCKGLRPPLLDDLGLEPALQLLADDFESQFDIRLNLQLPDEIRPMAREVSLCAYRIAQESLTNVRRHSRATEAEMTLTYTATGIELNVTDNGRGFNLNELSALQGLGLQNITERAALAGGVAEIFSESGQGTRIVFRAPYFLTDTESSLGQSVSERT